MTLLNNIKEYPVDFKKNIGFSTNIYKNPQDIIPLMGNIADCFSIIEIEFEHKLKNIINHSACDKSKWIESLLHIKQERSLYFSAHAPYVGRSTDIAANDDDIRHHAVAVMKKTLDLAHALGIKVFTCHPGYLDTASGFEDRLMTHLKLSLDELVSYANKLSIIISLENTGRHRPKYLVFDNETQVKLCENHGVGITLDLIHYTSFNAINDDYYHGLQCLIPYVKNVHFSDMKADHHAHLPLGEGDFPYHQVLSFLYTNGYDGNAIIEETGMRYAADLYLTNGFHYKQSFDNNGVHV